MHFIIKCYTEELLNSFHFTAAEVIIKAPRYLTSAGSALIMHVFYMPHTTDHFFVLNLFFKTLQHKY